MVLGPTVPPTQPTNETPTDQQADPAQQPVQQREPATPPASEPPAVTTVPNAEQQPLKAQSEVAANPTPAEAAPDLVKTLQPAAEPAQPAFETLVAEKPPTAEAQVPAAAPANCCTRSTSDRCNFDATRSTPHKRLQNNDIKSYHDIHVSILGPWLLNQLGVTLACQYYLFKSDRS